MTNLYGADVMLQFDPDKVSVVDAYPDMAGVQMQPGELWTDGDAGYIPVNTVDAAQGTARFVASLKLVPPATGDHVLFSITFRAKTSAGAAGAYALRNVQLASKSGIRIPVRWAGVDIYPFDGHPIYVPLAAKAYTRK